MKQGLRRNTPPVETCPTEDSFLNDRHIGSQLGRPYGANITAWPSTNDDNPLRHFVASPLERLGFFRRTAQAVSILENQVEKSRHIGFPPNSWASMAYIDGFLLPFMTPSNLTHKAISDDTSCHSPLELLEIAQRFYVSFVFQGQ